jgi:EpsI family protein
MREWRLFGPAAVLLVGCFLTASARRQERVNLAKPLRTMPLVLAGFSGTEREIGEQEQKVAGMSDYVFRVFAQDTANVFSVYVGYYESQTTGKTIHSPRNCLPGAGWQTVESGKRPIDVGGRSLTVNRYILANGPTQAVVYYWYQGRGRVAASEYSVKWDLLRDAATRGRTEEALVRIMVPIASSRSFSAADWHERQARADLLATRIAAALVPSVERMLPPWSAPAT